MVTGEELIAVAVDDHGCSASTSRG